MSRNNLELKKPSEINNDHQTLNNVNENHYSWNFIKLDFEKYIQFNNWNNLTLGLSLEGVYSSKKKFKSKVESKETGEVFDIELFPLDYLTTPQFLPFWNSERYLSTFHTASSYLAFGLDPIFYLTKKLHLRFPFYLYNYFFQNSSSQTNTEKLEINPNLFSEFFINNGIHLVNETPFFQ